MNASTHAVDVVAWIGAIAVGALLFSFAPAPVRFRVRMLEWQIEATKQQWPLGPYDLSAQPS